MLIKDYKLILEKFKDVPVFEKTTNYFDIIGYSHYENIVSNLLKYFLNPNEDHLLRNLVLRSLLKTVDSKYSYGSTEGISVSREVYTSSGKRIDLIVETTKFLIIIENKIFHHLANDLKEYKKYALNRNKENKDLLLIVLSIKPLGIKERERSENLGFKNITYRSLLIEIKNLYSSYSFNANPKFLTLFHDFISSIENLINMDHPNDLLHDFFKNNSKEIESLSSEYHTYKSDYIIKRVDIIKKHINDLRIAEVNTWVFDKKTLVQDIEINDIRIAVDTRITLNDYKIVILGRDEKSRKYIHQPWFLKKLKELGDIYNSVNRDNIIYRVLKSEVLIQDVSSELVALIQCLVGIKKSNEKAAANNG